MSISNTQNYKKKSLVKYSDKNEVLRKWIQLNKKLNKNNSKIQNSSLIIEAFCLVEYVIDNQLKDFVDIYNNKSPNGENVYFMKKVYILKDKGYNISNDDICGIKKIKGYRNISAHNTGSIVSEEIDFESIKNGFEILGKLLNKIGVIDATDIVVGADKLRAKEGDIIDDVCKIEKLIGEGASSKVFKGFDIKLGIDVAIKEIKHNSIKEDILHNEKKILLTLKYKGIPRIYDIINYNRTYYIIMEFIEGTNLKEFKYRTGKLAFNVITNIGKELCDILEYLHSKNIIYNDLKPSNIIIDNHNDISLVDFGISRDLSTVDSNVNRYSGTIAFSSPQQLDGEKDDIRNDIYSLGATLYFLSEGINPIVSEEQRFKKSTEKRLVYIIEKAMNYDISKRYESIEAIKKDLKNIENGKKPVNIGNYDRNNTIYPRINKRGLYIGMIVTGAVILIGIFIFSNFNVFGFIGRTYYSFTSGINQFDSINNVKEGNNQVTDDTSVATASADAVQANTPVDIAQNNNENNTASNNTSNTSNNTKNSNENAQIAIQQNIGSAFDGKLNVTVKSFTIDGSDMTLEVNVRNNYETEINLWPNGTYIINQDGKIFEIDMHKQLAKGGAEFTVQSGGNKDFKFFLSGYEKSTSLTFKLDKIWCMSEKSMKEKIAIKLQ